MFSFIRELKLGMSQSKDAAEMGGAWHRLSSPPDTLFG